MIHALRNMSWICFLIHQVIYIWDMPRLMRSVMLLLVTGFKKASMLCIQLVGMPLVCRLKMPPLSAMKIRASGPMKISPHRRHRCDVMPAPLIGIASLIPATPSITSGINGSLPNFMIAVWHIGKILQLTGVQDVRRYWPMNR